MTSSSGKTTKTSIAIPTMCMVSNTRTTRKSFGAHRLADLKTTILAARNRVPISGTRKAKNTAQIHAT